MPAFMVITATLSERDSFVDIYGKPTADLVARFGGRYVLRGPGATLLENGYGETGPKDGCSVAISEWPDRESALAFWNSPEYAVLKARRAGIADALVLLVDSLPSGG